MENITLEFKLKWNDEYLKTIVAFANTNGGKILIGVDDNGVKIGLDNKKKLLEDLPNKIAMDLNISINIVEKKIRILKKKELVEFIGATKIGGYFLKKEK